MPTRLAVFALTNSLPGAPGSHLVYEPGSCGFGFLMPLFEVDMPDGLKRIYGRGDLHFVTFSCYQRLDLLNAPLTRDLFVEHLKQTRDELQFNLVGYVVMPNHVHLLMNETLHSTPSDALHNLKLGFSRNYRKREKLARLGQTLQPSRRARAVAFWQPRFHDFNVYSNAKKREKLNYMHANPVVRGLVNHPRDWPWSSWSFYMVKEPGLIRIDAQ